MFIYHYDYIIIRHKYPPLYGSRSIVVIVLFCVFSVIDHAEHLKTVDGRSQSDWDSDNNYYSSHSIKDDGDDAVLYLYCSALLFCGFAFVGTFCAISSFLEWNGVSRIIKAFGKSSNVSIRTFLKWPRVLNSVLGQHRLFLTCFHLENNNGSDSLLPV